MCSGSSWAQALAIPGLGLKLEDPSASTCIPPEGGRVPPCFHTRHVMVRLSRPPKPAFSGLPALSLFLFLRSCLFSGVCPLFGVPLTYKPCPCWPQVTSCSLWDSLRSSHRKPQELLSTHHVGSLNVLRFPFCYRCVPHRLMVPHSATRVYTSLCKELFKSTCRRQAGENKRTAVLTTAVPHQVSSAVLAFRLNFPQLTLVAFRPRATSSVRHLWPRGCTQHPRVSQCFPACSCFLC